MRRKAQGPIIRRPIRNCKHAISHGGAVKLANTYKKPLEPCFHESVVLREDGQQTHGQESGSGDARTMAERLTEKQTKEGGELTAKGRLKYRSAAFGGVGASVSGSGLLRNLVEGATRPCVRCAFQ